MAARLSSLRSGRPPVLAVGLAVVAALVLPAAPASASLRFQAKVADSAVFPRGVSFGCHGQLFVVEDDAILAYADLAARRPTHFAIGSDLRGVAADCGESAYVLAGDRVLKYRDLGGYGLETESWGGKGSAEGKLERPMGIAVDSQGNVYVADTGNNRIQKFDPEGRVLAVWGKPGSGDGALRAPTAIAFDHRGNAYVADRDNDRIEKFGPGGQFLASIGSSTQTRRPVAVAVDRLGLYTLDSRGDLRRFNLTGTPLDQMKTESSSDEFRKPGGLAVDSQGRVYVADEAQTGVRRYVYSPELPSFVTAWGGPGAAAGQFRRPSGLSYDRWDRLWVADTGNSRIQQFTSNGGFVSQLGERGVQRGHLEAPAAVSVGPRYVYIADTGNGRVQKWTSAGAYLRTWRSPGGEEGPQPFAPSGIVQQYAYHNSDGSDVWVADPRNDQLLLYSSSGTYIGRFGSPGSGPGQFRGLTAIADDTHGYIYAVDSGNDRIEKFTANGDFVRSFGGPGNAPDELRDPRGVAIDPRGNVLVADTGHDRIVKYDPLGGFLFAWGGKGSGKGQFDAPGAIVTDRAGNVYVADTGNDRIEKFHDPTYPQPPAAPASSRELGLVRPPRVQWHKFEAELRFAQRPPDRSTGCIHPEPGGPIFGIGAETCYGEALSGPNFTAPFDGGTRAELGWADKGESIRVKIGVDAAGAGWESLEGWCPPNGFRNPDYKGVLYVTGGEIDEWLTLKAHSGDNFAQKGERGGPLLIETQARGKDPFGGTLYGYKVRLSGYLRY